MSATPQQKIVYYINKIVKVLEKEREILSKNHWLSKQRVVDIKEGVFRRKSGILVPINIAQGIEFYTKVII